MTLNTELPMLALRLGELTLPVLDYQLKIEVPVIRQTLCDGSLHRQMLSENPCLLTVSGKMRTADSGSVTGQIESALRTHQSFRFTFAGIRFAEMQLTEAVCSVTQNAHSAEYTLTMTGVTEA